MIKNNPKETVISDLEWDELVQKTYGKIYCFQQQNDCRDYGTTYALSVPSKINDFQRDTIPEVINGDEMGVSFAAWIARDPKEWNGKKSDVHNLDMFWERNFYPSLEMLANDLYARGLIEAGEYLIRVD